MHKTSFSCTLRHAGYEIYQHFDEKSLMNQTENECKNILKSFVTRASLRMYIVCNCDFCVVCEEVEDDVQE